MALSLPSVIHDQAAAILLVDTDTGEVVYLNDRARQLAPAVVLPLRVQEWSDAAGLHPTSSNTAGGVPAAAGATLTRALTGRYGNVLLRRTIDAVTDEQALWALGVPLDDAPASLQARSMLVLMPVHLPAASPDPERAQTPSVLASSLAMTISDTRSPDNPLIWVSPSFEQVTGYAAEESLGRNCRFLQGLDTDPDTVTRLREGIAAEETVSATLVNYRRDGSAFHNHLIVSPVFDAAGQLRHYVSVQSDVTQQVLTAEERDQARADGRRARAAQAATEEAQRLARLLLTVSEALAAAITVEDVSKAVTDVVATELGAAGGGLMLADTARTHLQYVSMDAMPPGIDVAWSRIDWREDAPPALAARTRRAIYHRDSTDMSDGHPGLASHAAVPQMGATVNLPLIAGDEVIGAVFLYWDQPHDLSAPQREAVEALGRYAAQAVQRASLFAARRTTAEVLQRSLLTHLPEPDHLELRARYVPAAAGEHVGGDWYDAVVLPDGATALVIGDVTGHDISAAAQMGQLRGLLRAFAYDREDSPAQLVSRLDRAMHGLRVSTLATLILAKIEQTETDARQGLRRLRWTNAGHPPPILLLPDGSTQVLQTAADLLIGLAPEAPRTDHIQPLPSGSTLLLFTDGLIEHRGRSIDDGIIELRRFLATCIGHTVNDLLDRIVAELVGESPDDDCAILAVRAHPEDQPRPAEAGPNS